jgi:hypothetical protein
MCTVTYIPRLQDNSFILTSNRDEKAFRPTISPAIYRKGTIDIVFPKDEKAGGSWIAMNNQGKVNCLLNGGLISHQKQNFHTVSRGNVLVELTTSELSVSEYFSGKELVNVEPFTIVALEHKAGIVTTLIEFIWDGNTKYFRHLDSNDAHIWSSVTLYNNEHRKMRKEWFENFYNANKEEITPEKIMDFHSGTHSKDDSINIMMQRTGGLKTVSITQISITDNRSKMSYFDLLNESVNAIEV